ncbi:D-alanyl-D-alanine carboxypeptidase/D-alanyl-D-alanine-endopeptidase [Lysinibacillus endophyticus]|uniref:D-alanyl-D-alanine carboxypeptidase/D-alanyl-D-alanine-endopeptidase n=1 Tax=Ureibacillus endophyticus TaxID=1978490 RepID=A0A494Z928_9BACL|nr:D-alanyl-D-alanine carboxypeptidase/D-alanyl-D-alanine-endopeptidase [Lysinibacillus endophyticus]MCP1145302.1 D-alanyl-D-alanine carboxypeptidase/D-alanyl-D-alanine-endopeptidase [Lysinibacillus endophyticus]RKQ19133.1 D-alanyl-D-alanine carboxypeptidase/D-alanyl-D-alanine-endopeptidase [Lysinibacillus endophyticus]
MKKSIIILCLLLLLTVPSNITLAKLNLEPVVQNQLGNSDISVSVRDVVTGEILYEKNGEVAMKPASTLKLLTAAAALDILGSNYRFHTKLYIDGEMKGKMLEGDIYIKGEGDPTLQKHNFEAFADALKHYGIESVTGNLYGDDTVFSGSQLTPGVATSDESYYYAARTTALTMSPDNDFDAGSIIIHVTPSAIGKAPIIQADPSLSGMNLINQAKTVVAGEETTIEIERQYRTDTIVVTGNIPLGKPFKDWVTLYDPTINTLYAIKETFEEKGITFTSQNVIKRGKVPIDAQLIYAKHSVPLKNLIVPFLKLSNNSIADILVKTIGKETYGKGRTDYGVKALNAYGTAMGLNMERWYLEDGSGISHENRVTANELSHLLVKVKDEPSFKIFYDSLPVGGSKDRLIGGSLRKRFLTEPYKNHVVAKTGSISGVYTLAGYVKANSGKTYAFTIMTQNQSTPALNSIDEVVKTIIAKY